MTEWQIAKLSELATIKYGKNQKDVTVECGNIPIYGTGGIMGYASKALYDKPSVLIGRKGTIDKVRYVTKPFWTVDTTFYTIIDDSKILPRYFYYLLSLVDLSLYNEGTTIPSLRTETLNRLEFYLPPLEIQNKIVSILGALDDKIELNQRQNNNLEQQAQALVQEHILKLETIVPLDEFCNVFTGRKNANEFDASGANKFFTCGPEALTINSFIYDGPAVIISGNGAYTGRTRFYNGKFDLYQRTYACTLKEKINLNYIYLLYPLLKMVLEKKLMGGTHGSAIPYIVMNDIAKFEVPFDKDVFDNISPAIKVVVDKIQANEQENEKLAAIRDALLPKLMSGEIDVSNVDISALTSTDKLSFRCRSPPKNISYRFSCYFPLNSVICDIFIR